MQDYDIRGYVKVKDDGQTISGFDFNVVGSAREVRHQVIRFRSSGARAIDLSQVGKLQFLIVKAKRPIQVYCGTTGALYRHNVRSFEAVQTNYVTRLGISNPSTYSGGNEVHLWLFGNGQALS